MLVGELIQKKIEFFGECYAFCLHGSLDDFMLRGIFRSLAWLRHKMDGVYSLLYNFKGAVIYEGV